MRTPALAPVKPISGELWAKVAAKKPELGSRNRSSQSLMGTNWLELYVTCKGDQLLKVIENFTGNVPGSADDLQRFQLADEQRGGGAACFVNQPMDETIFWGYGLYAGAIGDYVKSP